MSDDQDRRRDHLRALKPGERVCPRCKGKRKVLGRGRELGGGGYTRIVMTHLDDCPRCGGRGTLPPDAPIPGDG